MKFSATHLLLACGLLASSSSATPTSNLRSPDDTTNNNNSVSSDSTCGDASSEETCRAAQDQASGNPCVWCTSQAVPSACFSPEQSESLPASVFHCETPPTPSGQKTTAYTFLTNRHDHGSAQTMTHILSHKVNDAGSAASEICDPASKSISGYMDIQGSKFDQNGENKHLFYWMFEKRGTQDLSAAEQAKIPFVVWLTGGPGCSSTLALLTENGPCSVNPDADGTTVNPYSWTEAAHVLWLDQPAGVGFSYGDETDSNENMIAEDAYYFLQAFFQTYPEYVRKDPFLYIVGESYGGHYAPAIAHRVWQGNEAVKAGTADDKIELPLGGLGIGNGLTNPEAQYPWYPEMVYNNSHNIKVVDENTYEGMKAVVPKCTKLIHQCNSGDSTLDSFACQTAFVVCNMGLTSPYQMTGLNPYDIRKKCEKPPLCYDFSPVQTWLNKPDTMSALGVDTNHVHRWESCNFGINGKFHTDWMKDFSPFVLDLLDKAGIPVLIYAGDVDFICNYLGNQAWSKELPWTGKDGFNAATPADWKGQGLARVNADDKKLTFLQVYDAGHMVPADQPKVALDMIGTFLKGDAFA